MKMNLMFQPQKRGALWILLKRLEIFFLFSLPKLGAEWKRLRLSK